jgi:hypothetical protein
LTDLTSFESALALGKFGVDLYIASLFAESTSIINRGVSSRRHVSALEALPIIHLTEDWSLFDITAGFLLHLVCVTNPVVRHQVRLEINRKTFSRCFFGGHESVIKSLIHWFSLYIERIIKLVSYLFLGLNDCGYVFAVEIIIFDNGTLFLDTFSDLQNSMSRADNGWLDTRELIDDTRHLQTS